MSNLQNIKLNIIHKDDYKILNIYFSEKFTNNEVNTTIVMFQNFFDNCQKNNIKFAWIFNCKKLQELPILALEKFSTFCKTNYDIIKNNLICNCLLSNEGLFKKFFGVFTKIYNPVKPIKNFLNIEDCEEFIQDCCNEKYNNDSIIMN